MLRALADRFAEYLHGKVRKNYWGYAKDEILNNTELIKESYRGIRPAPEYPACPDYTEKVGLFELLDARKLSGLNLTDSLAMLPATSVSGWYFGNPNAKYFGLGKIGQDQVDDRKGEEREVMFRWLSPVIQ